jgi:hypothetical protein
LSGGVFSQSIRRRKEVMVDISAEDLLVEDLEYADDDLYEWGITGVAPSPVSVPFTDNNEWYALSVHFILEQIFVHYMSHGTNSNEVNYFNTMPRGNLQKGPHMNRLLQRLLN